MARRIRCHGLPAFRLIVVIMPRSPSICWPVCGHQTKDKTGKTGQNPLRLLQSVGDLLLGISTFLHGMLLQHEGHITGKLAFKPEEEMGGRHCGCVNLSTPPSASMFAVIARSVNGGFARSPHCSFRGRQTIAHLAVRPDGDIAPPRHIARIRVSLGLLQNPDDLLARETYPIHRPSSPRAGL